MSTEGNRFEPAAARNMLALFVFEDWARIRELLGVLQKDMKTALRNAVRQTGQWANREGARGLAKAVNVPLNVMRKGLRIKFQYQSIKGFSTARLWYGLNPISAKYLGVKQQKKGVRVRGNVYRGGFVSAPLGGHAFQRAGKARTPLVKVEHSIAERGDAYLTKFESEVAAKFVDLFFSNLDKISGRDAGESRAIAGGAQIARR
jgi:hypothetical protein